MAERMPLPEAPTVGQILGLSKPALEGSGSPYTASFSKKQSSYETLTDEQLLIAESQTTTLLANKPADPFEEAALLDTIDFLTSTGGF